MEAASYALGPGALGVQVLAYNLLRGTLPLLLR